MQTLTAKAGIREAFSIRTCNRAEWYVVAADGEVGRRVLAEYLGSIEDESCQWLGHEAAVTHLMRVACGLESMVLGEDEILGQLRRAVADAGEIDATGDVLEDVLWAAIHCGERARAETAINEGTTSIGRAAVEYAARQRSLSGATAAIVGAGEIAHAAGHAFVDAGVDRLIVANRTVPNAATLAADVAIAAEATGLESLATVLDRSDVVVTATAAPEPIVDASVLPAEGDVMLIDIAQPRDVDPMVPMPTFDLDDLRTVTDETWAERETSAAAVEAMIDREAAGLLDRLKRAQADEVIATMYESAEAIKTRELAEARRRLAANGELSDTEADVLEGLADALVGQLLAAPTKSLRDAAGAEDWETIQAALALFDPEFPTATIDRSRNAVETAADDRT